MDHETFVTRAELTARNAQGVRPLARQVRLLYDDIRQLQREDNAYGYIAEVIATARGDKTDIGQIAERIRVYHYRDRMAWGDRPVGRGIERAIKPTAVAGSQLRDPAPAKPGDMARLANSRPPPLLSAAPPTPQPLPPRRHEAAAPAVAASGLPASPAREELMSLTRAMRQRSGRRRLVDGG